MTTRNFIFNTPYDFKDRFNGEPDYFTPKAEKKGFLLATNFVPDAVNLPLISAKERGAGGGHIRFNMSGGMPSHISQFPVGTYKKAHCHGPSAHVIILSGEGFSLMWHEGQEPQRFDWQVGTLIVPPNRMFHQHFNTGPSPARYLAFKHEVATLAELAGRADRLDQPAHRRRPDRLCRRDAGNPRHVRRRAGEARHDAEDGRRLPGRACGPAAKAGAERSGGITRRQSLSDATDAIAEPRRRPARAGPQHQGRGGGVGALDQKRVFVRALEGTYGNLVKDLFTQPRVYKSRDLQWKGGPSFYGKKVINPQSAKIAQSIETHIEVFAPGGYGQKHGHMNSAVFYVLKGKGHDVHDGRRMDWEAGDALLVENACVHQHFSDEPDDEIDRAGHEGEAAVPVHAHDVPEGRGIPAQGRDAEATGVHAADGSVRR